jgi:hypothetical protein
LSREEAVEIVNSLQGEKPFNDLEDFFEFSYVNKRTIDETVEKF